MDLPSLRLNLATTNDMIEVHVVDPGLSKLALLQFDGKSGMLQLLY